MPENPYLITVGASNASARETENDDTLAADLAKTIGWLRESKSEYEELAPKIERNRAWFIRNEVHPKYDNNLEIFTDQKERAAALLDRLESLRSLGGGEFRRMSDEGIKQHKSIIDQFLSLDTWVRQIRKEAAERDGLPF